VRALAILKREFYRNFRGPSPSDEEAWSLVLDQNAMRLTICHEWETARHSGVDEFPIDEFLAQNGPAQEALTALLFETVEAR
jgi:hypothetical protein